MRAFPQHVFHLDGELVAYTSRELCDEFMELRGRLRHAEDVLHRIAVGHPTRPPDDRPYEAESLQAIAAAYFDVEAA